MIFAGKLTKYAQSMGATDTNGFVTAFPFSIAATNSGTLPRQIWVDTVNGNDSYNGFSPYPGFQLNGTGDKFQVGATGQGSSNVTYGPKATFFAAYQLIPGTSSNRVGNQIFLAQGQTFYEGASTDSFNNRSGFSVAFPFCIQSCDMSDPLNTATHGRATGSNRPKLATTLVLTVGQNYTVTSVYATDNPQIPPRGNFAIRGIAFDSGTVDNCGLSWVGNPYNVLFENCTFPGSGLGLGSSNFAEPGRNTIFRHCSMWGNWSSTGGHPGGIGTGHCDRLVVEDCVVWHTGWPLSNPRRNLATFTGKIDNGAGGSGNTLTVQSGLVADTAIAIGQTVTWPGGARTITAGSGTSWTVNGTATTVASGPMGTTDISCPDIFKQGAYASYGSNDQSVYRRNVIVDNSASGLSGRGNMLAYHNVLIDNPVQMVAGGSVNPGTGGYGVENPSGVDFNYHHNLLMGGADITVSEIRGQGISTQNGRRGSCVKNNLFINNPDYSQGIAYVIQPDAAYDQPSYCEIAGNYVYNYTPTLILNGGGSFTAQRLTTYDGASTPSPSGGTNPTLYGTNKLWDSSNSPYTNAQIYTALQGLGYGSGDKATLMAAMVAAPELPWAERVLAQVGTMFSFDFALAA